MKAAPRILKDTAVTVLVPGLAYGISILIQRAFSAQASIPAIFVLAVFLVSLLTDGYFYGVAATLASVFAVNFAFTFPYFMLNFTIPENGVSAAIMLAVALATCTLTTKVKHQEAIKAEGERERTRANLLRAVSHDLRTPLTSIYGASAALLENRDAFTEEQRARMLQSIRDDSDWLMRMMENILSITRLDGGKVRLIKTPVALDELVDSVLVKFKKRYPGREVRLELPNYFVAVPMDAILIEQVLVNLLENAVLHAKGMSQLSLGVFLLARNVIFEVADNGCGIDEERIRDIFSGSYSAGDVPSDGRKSNAGIGLSVCATIIRAHGGDLKGENRRAGGAVFRFSLNLEDDRHA